MLENNAQGRFTAAGGHYFAAWEPSRELTTMPDSERAKLVAALEASLVPAPRGEVIIALTRLAAHFWNDRSQTQWTIIFEDYAADLADMPADIVAEGIKRYRHAAKFWPKVSELLEHMTPLLAQRRRQLQRLKGAPTSTPQAAGPRVVVPAIRRFGGRGMTGHGRA